MNKKILAKKVASKTLLSQKEAVQVLDAIFDGIVEMAQQSGEVSIVGFGKFYLYTHNPRPVRNPKTQEQMVLKSYKSLKFKPSDRLKKYFKNLE